jgi:hypothetical protein
MIRLLPVLLLSGCAVAWSPDLIREEQPDESFLYTISISATYPKKQFMNAQERAAYIQLPPHAQQNMMEYYKQREKDRERSSEVLDCLMRLPPNLEC